MTSVWNDSKTIAGVVSMIAFAVAGLAPTSTPAITSAQVAASSEAQTGAGKTTTNKHQIQIESIEPAGENDSASTKEVAWLGIGTEEVPEALAAQLDLKSGAGLVVTYVDDQSPAAKTGLQKNDVIVELNDQMLVHPSQLRKLVQMQQPGDSVKITFFRSGKKENLTATLAKAKPGMAGLRDLDGSLRDLHLHLKDLPIKDTIRQEMERVREALAKAGIDQESVQREIRRSLDAARKGMEEALRNATNAHRTFGPAMRTLRELAHKGVVVDNDATVTVKSHRNSVKTIVKSDDSGTYVLVANPRKQLTAHDRSGKLLFDGEIETKEQQEKVPAEVWQKVEPMLHQIEGGASAEAEAEKP